MNADGNTVAKATARQKWSARGSRWGYNLHTMLVGLGCVIGFMAAIAIVRAMRARSSLNENRKMRDYLQRITSDRNPDF